MHLMSEVEPHPEARRPPGADHAQHGVAARHRRHPAGLPSRLLPRLYPAARERAKSGGAPQPRVHAARDPPAAGELRASRSTRLETGEFRDLPHPEYGWVRHCWSAIAWIPSLRGDGIYAVGRKTGPVQRALSGVAVLMSARVPGAASRSWMPERGGRARSSLNPQRIRRNLARRAKASPSAITSSTPRPAR